MKFLIIFFTCIQGALAYVPPIETLLSNPSNPSLGKNAVSVNMIMGELKTEVIDKSAFTEINKVEGQALKFIVNNSQGQKQYLTVIYQDKNFDNNIVYSKLSGDDIALPENNNNDYDKSLLLAVFSILFNNDATPIFKLCKSLNCQFVTNEEQVNKEKLESLEKYKNTVIEKNEPSESETSDGENKLSVSKINEEFFYKANPNIKLDKMGTEFFWRYSDGVFDIKFDKTDHELRSISLTHNGKTTEVLIQKYSSINNEFMAPMLMLVKTSRDKTYKIKIEKMEVFQDSIDKMRNRAKNYQELQSRSKISTDHFLAE